MINFFCFNCRMAPNQPIKSMIVGEPDLINWILQFYYILTFLELIFFTLKLMTIHNQLRDLIFGWFRWDIGFWFDKMSLGCLLTLSVFGPKKAGRCFEIVHWVVSWSNYWHWLGLAYFRLLISAPNCLLAKLWSAQTYSTVNQLKRELCNLLSFYFGNVVLCRRGIV